MYIVLKMICVCEIPIPNLVLFLQEDITLNSRVLLLCEIEVQDGEVKVVFTSTLSVFIFFPDFEVMMFSENCLKIKNCPFGMFN